MTRLIIADDHAVVREGLRFVVSQDRQIQVVGEVGDGDELIQVCRQRRADVVLLDVTMPGPGVLEVIHRLRDLQADIRILVLSVHPEQQYARRVLQAGADGYLTKNHSSSELVRAIRQVHAGRKYVTASWAEDFVVNVSTGRDRLPHDLLSNREYDVLVKISEGKPMPLIAEMLHISPKTIRTYRGRILEKLQLTTTAELICYAIQHGLVTNLLEHAHARTQASYRQA
jgi:two-component system, NarL family, invasion response regulator UvrY